MRNALFAVSLALAGYSTALATPMESPPVNLSIDIDALAQGDLAIARGGRQAGLDQMLAKYDRMQSGTARDALAQRIDKVAAQKYATVSRLYWYTELAEAKAEAARTKKPILALRMLGRLDEDLSCANSRFFRATLYANKELSTYLKNNFVLYWSSERAVPRVTIDFGDGRTIESTTTGNSAHYILDAKGDVLDVLPGLYSPFAFKTELEKSRAHAKALDAAPASQRRAKIAAYHEARINEIRTASVKLNVYSLRGTRVSPDTAVSLAQRATMTKARVEVPQLRKITTAELMSIDETEVATWASFGEQLWPKARPAPSTNAPDEELAMANSKRAGASLLPRDVFDEQSLSLVAKLHGDAPEAEKQAMFGRLAQSVLADSALNQLRLRVEIAAHLMNGTTDFAQVNDFIYAKVFHTPKSDPWLGLHTRTDFTGLPDDGITMPAKAAQR